MRISTRTSFADALRRCVEADLDRIEESTALFRIDERNDRRLAALSAGSTVGLVYGIVTRSSAIGAVVGGLLYGVLGAIIAAPIAFAIKWYSR